MFQYCICHHNGLLSNIYVGVGHHLNSLYSGKLSKCLNALFKFMSLTLLPSAPLSKSLPFHWPAYSIKQWATLVKSAQQSKVDDEKVMTGVGNLEGEAVDGCSVVRQNNILGFIYFFHGKMTCMDNGDVCVLYMCACMCVYVYACLCVCVLSLPPLHPFWLQFFSTNQTHQCRVLNINPIPERCCGFQDRSDIRSQRLSSQKKHKKQI